MESPEFHDRYSWWLEEEETFLHPLRKVIESQASNPEAARLVDYCYSRYSKYVDAKIVAAQEDVAYLTSGMWSTPLEAGFLWMGGWRPTTAIVLAYSLMGIQMDQDLRNLLDGTDVLSMAALSSRQLGDLDSVQQRIRDAEDDISNRLAVFQMLVADQQMARVTSAEPSPSDVRDAMEPKLVGLRDLLIEAEQLRLQTLREMMNVLTPLQAAQYTLAAFELAMALRKLGHQERAIYSKASRTEISAEELEVEGKRVDLPDAVQTRMMVPFTADCEARTPTHAGETKLHTNDSTCVVNNDRSDLNRRDRIGSAPSSFLQRDNRSSVVAEERPVLANCYGSKPATSISKANQNSCHGSMVICTPQPSVAVSHQLAVYAKPFHVKEDLTCCQFDRHGTAIVSDARESGSEASIQFLEDELEHRQDGTASQDSSEQDFTEESRSASMEVLQEISTGN